MSGLVRHMLGMAIAFDTSLFLQKLLNTLLKIMHASLSLTH